MTRLKMNYLEYEIGLSLMRLKETIGSTAGNGGNSFIYQADYADSIS